MQTFIFTFQFLMRRKIFTRFKTVLPVISEASFLTFTRVKDPKSIVKVPIYGMPFLV